MEIERNIARVRERIHAAIRRRSAGDGPVTLVAVTKTVPLPAVKEGLAAGITDIGESRVQEAQTKFDALGGLLSGVRRHCVGYLQTNKVKKAVELFDLIHSVDSVRLGREIDAQAARHAKVQECLVEVNVSAEETKFGAAPGEVQALLAELATLPNVKVRGLMGMAPYFDDPVKARPYFRQLRELFEAARRSNGGFSVLSMGMSNDFEVAIEEGSTLVRIGTALFGERQAR